MEFTDISLHHHPVSDTQENQTAILVFTDFLYSPLHPQRQLAVSHPTPLLRLCLKKARALQICLKMPCGANAPPLLSLLVSKRNTDANCTFPKHLCK